MTSLIRQAQLRLGRRNGNGKPLDIPPMPADASDTCVFLNRDKQWQAAWWREGRVAEPFGPAFASAGEAIAVSRDVRDKLGLAQ